VVKRVAGQRRPSASEAANPSGAANPSERGPVPAEREPDFIVVGRIGRPQGIKGEVTVEVRTDDPDDRFAPGRVLQTEPAERGPLTVESSRMQGRYLIVRFAGPTDRDDAEQLRDTMLLLSTSDLPPLSEQDEYYDTQLVGLAAQLEDGTELGSVVDVLHLPGGDVLAVERSTGGPDAKGQELLIPFVKQIVPTVDLTAGVVVVVPPEGLLDLSERRPDEG
jgi:16S rRNA processing protein RimM